MQDIKANVLFPPSDMGKTEFFLSVLDGQIFCYRHQGLDVTVLHLQAKGMQDENRIRHRHCGIFLSAPILYCG